MDNDTPKDVLEENATAVAEEEEGHVWMEVLDLVEKDPFPSTSRNEDEDEDAMSMDGSTSTPIPGRTTLQEQTALVIVPAQPGSFAVYPLRDQVRPSGTEDPTSSSDPDPSNNKDVLDLEQGAVSNRNHHSETHDGVHNEDEDGGEDASVVLVQAELAETLDDEERDRILQRARMSLLQDAVQASVIVGPGAQDEKKQEKSWMKGRNLFVVGGVCALIFVLVIVVIVVTQVTVGSNNGGGKAGGETRPPTPSPTERTFWIENRTVELQNMLLFGRESLQASSSGNFWLTPDDITKLYNISIDFWYDYLSERRANDLWYENPNAIGIHEFQDFTAIRFDIPPRGNTIELAAAFTELKLTYRSRVAVDFASTPPPVLTSTEMLKALNESCLELPDHLRDVIAEESPLWYALDFIIVPFLNPLGGEYNENPPEVDQPKVSNGTNSDGKPDGPENPPAPKEPLDTEAPDGPDGTKKPFPDDGTPSDDKESTDGTPSAAKSSLKGAL